MNSTLPPSPPDPPITTLRLAHVGACFKEAAHFLQNRALAWLSLSLAYFVLLLFLNLIPALGVLATLLLSPLLSAGFFRAASLQNREETFQWSALFYGFKHQWFSLAMLGVHYLLCLFVFAFVLTLLLGAVIDVGALNATAFSEQTGITPQKLATLLLQSEEKTALLFLAVFALVAALWLQMWFMLAPNLVVFRGETPKNALKFSLRAMQQNFAVILVFALAMIALTVLVLFSPLSLAALIVSPWIFIASFLLYCELFADPNAQAVTDENTTLID